MNRTFQTALVTSTLVLLSGSAPGKTRAEVGPQPTLLIHLYDQGQVPTGVLHSAIAEATRILKTIGIQITWEQPSVEAPEDQGIDMSGAASHPVDQRPYLVVRLVRRMPATALPGALGFALPFARSGAHVTILYDRVETSARSGNAAVCVVLGHVIAHEIGHILLGSSEHARGGLMQARWNGASWRLATAGLLAFGPEEGKRMVAGLHRFQTPHPLTEHGPVLAWSTLRRSPE